MTLSAIHSTDRLSALDSIRHESLANVYYRTRTRPPLAPFILDALDGPLSSLSTPTPLAQGDTIELHGGPGSGKSTLIEYLLLPILAPPHASLDNLPQSHPLPIPMGGRGLSVLFIDTDLRLDLVRLHSRLVSHAIRCASTAHPSLPAASDSAIHGWAHQLALASLARLRVVRATNHMELLATLHLLTTHPASSSASQPAYLIIDSLSSLLWPLKLAIPRPDYLDLAQLIARHFARLKAVGVTSIVTTWERHVQQPHQHTHPQHPAADPFGLAGILQGDVDAGHKVDAEARDRLGRQLAASVGARFLVRRAPPVVDADEDEDNDNDNDNDDAAPVAMHEQEPTYIAVQMVHPVVRPGNWVVVTSDGLCDYQPDDG